MCLRIGRTRLVGGKNFLKIKYGVTTLQKRALFHNRCSSNATYTWVAIGFRVSRNDFHSLLTREQHLLYWGVTNDEDRIHSRQSILGSPGRRYWQAKDPTEHDFEVVKIDWTFVIRPVLPITIQLCLTQVGTNCGNPYEKKILGIGPTLFWSIIYFSFVGPFLKFWSITSWMSCPKFNQLINIFICFFLSWFDISIILTLL